MEEKLFFIGLGIGAYALILRSVLKAKRFVSRVGLAVWHGLFCAGAGGILCGLIGSTFNNAADPFRFALYGVLPGLGVGILWSLWRKDAWEGILKEDLEWADTGFSAILLAAIIMYFFVQAFKIPSGSMRQTLIEGDHLFVNKFIYGTRLPFTQKKLWRWKSVHRGDIIVFRFPSENKESPHYGKDFIKRAIGLPGDTVEIKDRIVTVNGVPLQEPYIQHVEPFVMPKSEIKLSPEEYQKAWGNGTLAALVGSGISDNFGPIKVPEGYYFAMGDNRDRSYDSRFWGPLPDPYLKGKAWLVYWPLKRIKIVK